MHGGAEPAIGSSIPVASHPRAFGRTSNVWQYLDGVQERMTSPVTVTSRLSSQRRGELQLDPLDDDAGDADDSNDDESDLSQSGYSHQGRSGAGSSRSGGTGRRRRRESDKDTTGRSRHSFSSSKHNSVAFADGSPHQRHASGSSLKNVVSLPELPAGGRSTVKKSSLQSTAASGGNHIGANVALSVLNGAAGVPIWRRDRKAASEKTKVNVSEVMKTLNALGTSASAPALPAPSPASASLQPMTMVLQAAQPILLAPSNNSPTVATTSTIAAAVPAPGQATTVVSDADKLRNDFNSQRTRLSYGCSVAFELFNGNVMMVGSPDGQVRVQSLEKLQTLPQVKGYKDRAVFTLIDLSDPRSASSIRFGDAVWLQLSIGTGETSWEQGGVLGAKVREAPQLKALALSEGPSLFRNDAPAPVIVGHPVPIRAYLPKSRDDGDMQMDEIQSRVRNKTSKMLGKWVVRSAVHSSCKQADNFVYNNDEIYLEQDWFYLGADSDAGVAVLRQLPSALAATSPTDTKHGEYVVERRAAWRVRLLDSSNGSAGLSLAQQQMERLLLRAKTQLKQSKKMRFGQTRTYAPGIQGGAGFPKQLRAHVGVSISQCNARYVSGQEARLEALSGHLNDKALVMDVGVQVRVPHAASKRKGSVSAEMDERPANDTIRDSTKEAPSVYSSQLSKRGSIRRRSLPTPSDSAVTACGEGCGLCHSSTMGINLCSQLRHVMQKLRDEAKIPTDVAEGDGEEVDGQVVDDQDIVDDGNAVDSVDDDALSVNADSADFAANGALPAAVSPPSPSSSLVSTSRYMRSSSPACDTVVSDPLAIDPSQEERLRRLMATEDTAMMGIILFNERVEQDALAAEEQARIGLSPVAAQLRDRLKHVGILAQAHHLKTHEAQHGIGGHFQRLHAELSAEAAQTRKRNDDVSNLELDLSSTCPFNYPPEGFDVYGHKVDSDCEEDEATHTRMFPTEDELDLLAPIDTTKILDLYSQNWNAVLDMLEGFAELIDTHVAPGVNAAVVSHSRGALVELLDFTARASEFVCAVRVQVRVAELLHAISASEPGDFEGFAPQLGLLLEELEATSAFVSFFRERNAHAKRKKRGAR